MLSHRHLADDGSSTTELVLLMPAVLLAVMVSVQAGLYFHAQQVVEAAAHEAVEAAQVESGDDRARAEAESFLSEAGGVHEAVVDVTRTIDEVAVQVRGTAPNVLPFAVWHVDAAASGPVERFVPESQR